MWWCGAAVDEGGRACRAPASECCWLVGREASSSSCGTGLVQARQHSSNAVAGLHLHSLLLVAYGTVVTRTSLSWVCGSYERLMQTRSTAFHASTHACMREAQGTIKGAPQQQQPSDRHVAPMKHLQLKLTVHLLPSLINSLTSRWICRLGLLLFGERATRTTYPVFYTISVIANVGRLVFLLAVPPTRRSTSISVHAHRLSTITYL